MLLSERKLEVSAPTGLIIQYGIHFCKKIVDFKGLGDESTDFRQENSALRSVRSGSL